MLTNISRKNIYLTNKSNNKVTITLNLDLGSNSQNKPNQAESEYCRLFIPKLTNLKTRLNCDDKLFIDFLSKCLKLDPSARMSAK